MKVIGCQEIWSDGVIVCTVCDNGASFLCVHQRHILGHWRPSTTAQLLHDWDKGIEIVYGEGKYIFALGRLNRKGRTKISFTGLKRPTNQPSKDPFPLYSLSHHLHQLSKGPPLSSLSGEHNSCAISSLHKPATQNGMHIVQRRTLGSLLFEHPCVRL